MRSTGREGKAEMRSGGSIPYNRTHSDGLGISLCLHDELQAVRKERDCKLFKCLISFSDSILPVLMLFMCWIHITCFFFYIIDDQLSSDLLSIQL